MTGSVRKLRWFIDSMLGYWVLLLMLSLAAVVLTLGEMIFLCLFIMSLVFFAVRHRAGRWVPPWVKALVV